MESGATSMLLRMDNINIKDIIFHIIFPINSTKEEQC